MDRVAIESNILVEGGPGGFQAEPAWGPVHPLPVSPCARVGPNRWPGIATPGALRRLEEAVRRLLFDALVGVED